MSHGQISISAPRDRLALDLNDRWLRQIAPTPAEAEIDFLLLGHVALGSRQAIAAEAEDRRTLGAGIRAVTEVMAGGEMRPIGRQDDRAHRVVVHRHVKSAIDLVEHLEPLRVARFGAGEHDPRDALGRLLIANFGEIGRRVHAAFPRLRLGFAGYRPAKRGGRFSTKA